MRQRTPPAPPTAQIFRDQSPRVRRQRVGRRRSVKRTVMTIETSPTAEQRTSAVTATLTSAFDECYRRFPDRPAVIGEDGEHLTYAELGARARRLAGGLAELGMRVGDRAIVLLQNRPECFVIDHALAAGGFVRVALSYRLHAREIAQIAVDCDP